MLTIVLHQPQIPQNTGNIVRTASVTGSRLVLIPPLGFSISSRHLKRAGLDYWEGVDVEIVEDLSLFLENLTTPFTLLSSKGTKTIFDVPFAPNHTLIFGSETTGLPPFFLERWEKEVAVIPMVHDKRCLNLSNAVAITTYQALNSSGLIVDGKFIKTSPNSHFSSEESRASAP